MHMAKVSETNQFAESHNAIEKKLQSVNKTHSNNSAQLPIDINIGLAAYSDCYRQFDSLAGMLT